MPSQEHHRPLTFPRHYRLKRRRLIRPLFDRSRDDVGTIAKGCVRLLYRSVHRTAVGADTPLQIGFSAGRNARRAVDRNRIKRLMREAFRLNQHVLTDTQHAPDTTLTIMMLFRGSLEQIETCLPQDAEAAVHALARRIAPTP